MGLTMRWLVSCALLLISCHEGHCVVKAIRVSDAEIKAISRTIWEKDYNSLTSGRGANQFQVTVVPQGRRSYPNFFMHLDESVLNKPTYKALVNLLDNYCPYTRTTEANTRAHEQEQDAFLNAVLATDVMRQLHTFLRGKGLAASSLSGFKAELKQYWFAQYSRHYIRGIWDTSGFEHVFVGEIHTHPQKHHEHVSGFHGWVSLYKKEKGPYEYICNNTRQRINGQTLFYKGSTGRRLEPWMHGLKMEWKMASNEVYEKPITTMFVGVSPEYELAVYTLCFLARSSQDCEIYFIDDSTRLNINTRRIGRGRRIFVGQAHPG